MHFSVLGPVAVTRDSAPVAVTAGRQLTVLALLLAHFGGTVPVSRILAALWTDRAPANPRKALAWQVSRLRDTLGHPNRILWRDHGYRIDVTGAELDADRFTALLRRAARHHDDPATQAALLDAALALWRGHAYGDLGGHPAFRTAAVRLEELRMTAVEDRNDAMLRLGRHAALIPELAGLIVEHPLRQRLRGQYMLALYRDGRQAEALEAFRHGRAILIAEQGLEPEPALRRLHQDILRRNPSLTRAVSSGEPDGREPGTGGRDVTPAELPAAPRPAPGTDDTAAAIGAALLAGHGRPPLVAVSGPAGADTSALALRAAHSVARHFPDGQLYVDLRGTAADRPPLTVGDVLARLLRSLRARVPAGVTDADELAAHLRSNTAGRRLLIVLDDVPADSGIARLLPASPGSAVLVTGRSAPPGADVHVCLPRSDVGAHPPRSDPATTAARPVPHPLGAPAALALAMTASRLRLQPSP
ncbi:DNA-binding SARP family transcriptional activator [Stackebrandtia albiflava]|uniref:DNA-binding SARP family transcriptional activator n=1 Tax=Stackebrandtia albiflava TaxID=406432 RepID=A0A562V9N5_9ACTN|nr:AfsR/SARP family transcriptional regulator [Stackebrandtia albiflava]TWJ14573.1 DNA-binding SARP family transcriptional activator [Stackebrandtia albiflava]